MDFTTAKSVVNKIYESIKSNKEGKVADYIPQLADVNPDLFGISMCNVDGEIYSIGDSHQEFCLQSCCKPLNYCLARNLAVTTSTDVHEHVGYEPSGRAFNSFVLNDNGLPHNPMINAGAIMVSSLISPEEEPSKRFGRVKNFYQNLSGGVGKIGFENGVFLSEKHHADRNTSLAYYMRENGAFANNPTPNQISETLDLYFQCCSVTINTGIGAVMAANLANSGINPITKKSVVERNIVRDCLSLMFACGMYDFSGQFAFQIGLPAKSGVSGCLLLVVPNSFGICIWSPRLDKMGNSVRGVEFCKRFVEETKHTFHIFHNFVKLDEEKKGLTDGEDELVLSQRLISAAASNNLEAMGKLKDRIDFSTADYDGRTALHLAASEGHFDSVKFLIENGAVTEQMDRWGNTPYHEAKKGSRDPSSTQSRKKTFLKICEFIEIAKQDKGPSDQV